MKIPILYELECFIHKLKRAVRVKVNWLCHTKHMKHYSHILMLGKNCEPAFYFLRQFGFVDSNLFAWANINEKTMLSVLSTPAILLSGELRPVRGGGGMIQHIPTGFLFHGRSSDYTTASKDTLHNDIEELKSRLRYLIQKFETSLHSKQTKLFILTVPSTINPEQYLLDIHRVLQLTTQHFAMLCILEQKDKTPGILALQTGTLFVRFVDHFAPSNDVINLKAGDPKGWAKIS